MKNNYEVKAVLTGVVVGFIATITGTFFWILLFSDADIETTLDMAFQQNVIGAIVSAGAVLNILAFFLFLKQKKNYHARGVMIATLFVALFIVYKKFM